MTPKQFIDKWSLTKLTERSAAQQHFLDLCELLEEQKPAEADPIGEWYTFEKGVSKTDGTGGFADVWKRGCFGWEYKKDKANLDRAYQQLQQYSVALENPPLLVVADTKIFRVYTNWTNTVQVVTEFKLEDLAQLETREFLQNIFRNPEKLRPTKTRQQVTEDAAEEFVTIAEKLRAAGNAPEKVAHFLNRLVFCLFAEDVNLLPNDLFKRVIDLLSKKRDEVEQRSQAVLSELFAKMSKGGQYGLEHILYFNGGLFDDDSALPIDASALDILQNIAKLDWSAIDPTIFGTLFERFLDPDKRAQIGAHYTDPEKIKMIIEPIISQPLAKEWDAEKKELELILSKGRAKDGGPGKAAINKAEIRLDQFLKRIASLRVLDPACGSGNFLYMALQALKDLELRIIIDAETMGLARRVLHCGPENVKGIELNQYAAELARTTIWIGNIQWQRRNGFEAKDEPVLRPLNAIECKDALIEKKDAVYEETTWPDADLIVGNPPFLGGNKFKRELGNDYTEALRRVFLGRVPPTADLVCFWFEKASRQLSFGKTSAFGFVATSAIRAGNNLNFLDKLWKSFHPFDVWDDLPWTVEGANVRVSIICASSKSAKDLHLNGKNVDRLNSDLTSFYFGGFAAAKRLIENKNIAFQGSKKVGDFEINGEAARLMLSRPLNINGRPNSDVISRSWLSTDFMSRDRDYWIVDFGVEMSEKEASEYEVPFQHIVKTVKTKRIKNARESRSKKWWRHGDAQPAMRNAIVGKEKYIVTPEVAAKRLFSWAPKGILPDCKIMVIAKEDDVTFGILCSRYHEAWSKYNGGVRGASRTYTPSTTFETFPFPKGLTPDIPSEQYISDPRAKAIADAAKRIDEKRRKWLNPDDLVKVVPEVIEGFPERLVPISEAAASELRTRTITNLYNAKPEWLVQIHKELDAVVATAYGWPAEISDEDALAKLMELNAARVSDVRPSLFEDEVDDDGENE